MRLIIDDVLKAKEFLKEGSKFVLDGHGIYSGFKESDKKSNQLTFIRWDENGDLICRKYRRRILSRLPVDKFNQSIMLLKI